MNSNLHQQIYNNLNLKETDELVEIWQKNDRVEWTDDTFNIIRAILQERLAEIPPQNEPILEHSDLTEDKDALEDERISQDENMPAFYDPQHVLWLEKWLYRAAIASIVVSIVLAALELPRTQKIVWSYFSGDFNGDLAVWLISIVIFIFSVGLQSLILYFPLQALGAVLKILMEMEFNSRGGKIKTQN